MPMKKQFILPLIIVLLGAIAQVYIQHFLEQSLTKYMKDILSSLSLIALFSGLVWVIIIAIKQWVNEKINTAVKTTKEGLLHSIAELNDRQRTQQNLMANMNQERLEENRVLLYVIKHRTQDLISDINSINVTGLQKSDHFIMDMKKRFEIEKFHINNSKISQRVQDTITGELYKEN